ncbi:MAG: ABC transporter permease, partial [Saprospiraceae bacterium]
MIGNHFKLAWRNLVRHPSQSIINVSGLTLGLVAFIFILQYISLEKSVNLFHHNLDQVYRLINEDLKGNTWTEIEPGYGPTAKERIPEIIDYCRFEQGNCKGVVLN